MEIREATPDDAETVKTALLDPGFRETAAVDPEFSALDDDGVADAGIDRWLGDDDRAIFLAAADGDLAGYIAGVMNDSPDIYERGAYTHVDGLYVRAEYRRRGVATALFDRIEAWAAERGCEYLGVSAHVDNDAAVAMYDDDFERKFLSYRRPVDAGGDDGDNSNHGKHAGGADAGEGGDE